MNKTSDDNTPTIQGNFKITPSSRALENVSIGASTISVDSTVGFGTTGVIISGINTNIQYTSKSVNQFYGCTGITSSILLYNSSKSTRFSILPIYGVKINKKAK